MQARPTFGKRNAQTSGPSAPAARDRGSAAAVADPHGAVFAAIRAEAKAADPASASAGAAVEVPRSLRAGVLAGIVVACGLAGLDVTEKLSTMRAMADVMPDQPAIQMLGPALILVAVLGGGRSAAITLLLAHGALRRAGQTSHVAYMLGGASAAALVAIALMLLLGREPAHGLALDVLAGAAGGFFYRVFAGTRPKSA